MSKGTGKAPTRGAQAAMPAARKSPTASALLVRIYNQGEIPQLAHGWRAVIALPARKWVTVIDWTTLESATLSLPAWRTMRPLPADGLMPRQVQAVMHRRLRFLPAPTKAGHAAMTALSPRLR